MMLLALSLCEPYELLSEQSVWGMRMMILSSSRPREGIIQTLLVIAQNEQDVATLMRKFERMKK